MKITVCCEQGTGSVPGWVLGCGHLPFVFNSPTALIIYSATPYSKNKTCGDGLHLLSITIVQGLPTVEVENFMDPTPEAAIPFFPRLISRDMVSSETTSSVMS
jgi:hypothetical protein